MIFDVLTSPCFIVLVQVSATRSAIFHILQGRWSRGSGVSRFLGAFWGHQNGRSFPWGKWMENDGTCHQKRCMMTGGMEDIVMGL